MVKKFSFSATGRKLFAAEEVLVEVLNAKYMAGAAVVTDQVARQNMDSVRRAARNSLQNGQPRTTAFFKTVEEAVATAKTAAEYGVRHRAKRVTAGTVKALKVKKALAEQVPAKTASAKPAVSTNNATAKPVVAKRPATQRQSGARIL